MIFTSSQASKLLRKLNDERQNLIVMENKTASFIAATTENIEDVRPNYDYEATTAALNENARKIRVLKHAINVFNTTTIVPGFDMTIDAMLVYLPQLNERINLLTRMAQRLEKERLASRSSDKGAVVEYVYANYDIEKVKCDYAALQDELARAQVALDEINNTGTIEVDF